MYKHTSASDCIVHIYCVVYRARPFLVACTASAKEGSSRPYGHGQFTVVVIVGWGWEGVEGG